VGPMVRIRLPPARSLLRTSHSGRIPSENRGSESSPLDNTGKLLGERLGLAVGEVKLHESDMGWRRTAAHHGTLTVHHLGNTVSLGRYATHDLAAKAAAAYFAR
jgi:hypothetical protein